MKNDLLINLVNSEKQKKLTHLANKNIGHVSAFNVIILYYFPFLLSFLI